MRPLIVDDAREMLLALQDEIRRSEEARYDHRLHGVLLVAQGMNAPKVARLLGDGVRTVERFNEDGFAGLVEGERPGRPRKLSIEQLEELEVILRASPRVQGLSACLSANLWDVKTLSHWIKKRFSNMPDFL